MPDNNKEFSPYKEIYDFATKQVSESRNFFEKAQKITLAGILVLAVIAVGIFYYFIGQKSSEIDATVTRMISEHQKAIEAKVHTKTAEQIDLIQRQIQKRIEEEFKTEKMRALIHSVAQEQTKSGLAEVITRAVESQVRAAVKAETPKIQQTVIQETMKSIAAFSPIINKSIEEKAREAEGRIQNRIEKWEQLLQVQNLAILAKNGSGESYDQLTRIAGKTKNPDIQAICITTHNQLYLEMNQIPYNWRHFREKKTEQELFALLGDLNPLIRKAAIDSLVQLGNKSLVPILLEKAENDPAILVRQAAFHGLQVLTGEKIEALQTDQWKAWWEKNKANWPPKK